MVSAKVEECLRGLVRCRTVRWRSGQQADSVVRPSKSSFEDSLLPQRTGAVTVNVIEAMTTQQDRPTKQRHSRGKVSLYDAVAGRAGYEGFLTDLPPSKYRDTVSSSARPVPPEEVLFRRKGAPVRYEEDDLYFANRHLTGDQPLPDSDLLKTLHAYAADYYGTVAGEDSADFKSLDETALLALGILIEEAARDVVGKTGDLALAEPAYSEGRDDGSSTSDASG